jgi:hypothetical protein
MVLPITGQISFSQLQTEFGGTNPISLSEYYRDNPNKFAYAVTASPLIGNEIKMSYFRGVSKEYPPAEITYIAGSLDLDYGPNGRRSFEIIIYTNPYWTQTITMYGSFGRIVNTYTQGSEIMSYSEEYCVENDEPWWSPDYAVTCYPGYWYGTGNYNTIETRTWVVTDNLPLSTSTIYANNYAPFNVSSISTNEYYSFLGATDVISYLGDNKHQYIYYHRYGTFYVNIVYSSPP